MSLKNQNTNEILVVREVIFEKGIVILDSYENQEHYENGNTLYKKSRVIQVACKPELESEFSSIINNKTALECFIISAEKAVKRKINNLTPEDQYYGMSLV